MSLSEESEVNHTHTVCGLNRVCADSHHKQVPSCCCCCYQQLLQAFSLTFIHTVRSDAVCATHFYLCCSCSCHPDHPERQQTVSRIHIYSSGLSLTSIFGRQKAIPFQLRSDITNQCLSLYSTHKQPDDKNSQPTLDSVVAASASPPVSWPHDA